MRYTCKICNKWVKDKFIFGTLHLCLLQEERQIRAQIEFSKLCQQEPNACLERKSQFLDYVNKKYEIS